MYLFTITFVICSKLSDIFVHIILMHIIRYLDYYFFLPSFFPELEQQ